MQDTWITPTLYFTKIVFLNFQISIDIFSAFIHFPEILMIISYIPLINIPLEIEKIPFRIFKD